MGIYIFYGVIAAILGCFIRYKLKLHHLEKLADKIPGRASFPLVGYGLRYVNLKSIEDMWDTVFSLFEQNEGIQKVWIGPKLVIVLTDPSYIQAVLSNPSSCDKDLFFYNGIKSMTPGIFTENGNTWLWLRKALNKLFKSKILKENLDIFNNQSQVLCDHLAAKIGKGVFDIYDTIAGCSLEIICSTHTGVQSTDINIKTKYNFRRLMHQGLKLALHRVIRPQYYFDFLYNLTREGKLSKQIRSMCHGLSKEIVKKRLDVQREESKPFTGNGNYECYTDIILDFGIHKGMAPEKIAQWFTDLLIAGSHTTGITMSTLILFLAMYPEYQEKAYQEQLDIFGDSTRPATTKNLNAMTYLGQLFFETLRLVCPPGVARTLNSDITLDHYVLPEGASAVLLFYKLHRDPRYWKHPERFYPDHFLPEEVDKRPNGAFSPFGSGRRDCPGKAYSIQSVKTVLSMVIRRFKFTTPLTIDEIKYKYALMVEMANGYQVEIFDRS